MKRWISSHPARTGKLWREARIHLRISSGIRSISWMATLIDPFVRAWWRWVDATTAASQPANLHRNFWIDHTPTFHLITRNMNLRYFSRGFRDSPRWKPMKPGDRRRSLKPQTCYHTNNLALHEVQSDDEILDNQQQLRMTSNCFNQAGLAVDDRFELRYTSPSFLPTNHNIDSRIYTHVLDCSRHRPCKPGGGV